MNKNNAKRNNNINSLKYMAHAVKKLPVHVIWDDLHSRFS
jgi:hypothetical protein